MEIRQIRQQLTQVDLIVHRATLALRNDKAAPQELKDYVQRLGDQSQQAQKTVKEAQDETALWRYIYDMEQTSDRAKESARLERTSQVGGAARAPAGLRPQVPGALSARDRSWDNARRTARNGGDLVSTQVLKQHRACRGPEPS